MIALADRLVIVAGLFVMAIDVTQLKITGVALLGAVLVGIGLWMGGFFTREFWLADDETGARFAAIDDDVDRLALLDVPHCRVCRCTDEVACMTVCWWVEEDLCSSCADDEAATGGSSLEVGR